MTGSPEISTGKHLRLRGHEVLSHTTSARDGVFRCTVFLFDPHDERHDLIVFKGTGACLQQAEDSALDQALRFLEIPLERSNAATSSRCSLDIAGHRVEIFCDIVGEGRYQAFPFLWKADGLLDLIMQFHLQEAVTGDTPAAAMARCIERLESHFAQPAAQAQGVGGASAS